MKITCKNCGGKYDSSLSKCPFCSTMNKPGAYRDFRSKVSDIIDQMFGLKFETFDSRKKIVLIAIVRGLLIVALCTGIGILFGAMTNVNYYNDKEYDQDTLDDIIWEDENLDKLEKAYAENDFDTVRKLLNSNRHVSYNWEHYASFVLKDQYNDLMKEDKLNQYILEDVLYFLYYPDYYAKTSKMSKDEYQEYLEEKNNVIDKMKGFGYSEEELYNIYNSCKDGYGYLSASDVAKMMKEADNG